MALVNSEHLPLPPKSPVKYLASLMVSKQAFWILSACVFSSMCRSIITDESKSAVGLARSFPAISGAVPWTLSNNAPLRPVGVFDVKFDTQFDSSESKLTHIS